MYRLELQNTSPTMFFKQDGEFSTNESEAKVMSFEDAENKNIMLQLIGVKTWICSTD